MRERERRKKETRREEEGEESWDGERRGRN